LDSTQPDFLAVLDVTEDSGRYGRLVTTLPCPDYRMARITPSTNSRPTGSCLPNGFGTGQSFVFDLSDPAKPRLAGGVW
jgi:hypothetical protein